MYELMDDGESYFGLDGLHELRWHGSGCGFAIGEWPVPPVPSSALLTHASDDELNMQCHTATGVLPTPRSLGDWTFQTFQHP